MYFSCASVVSGLQIKRFNFICNIIAQVQTLQLTSPVLSILIIDFSAAFDNLKNVLGKCFITYVYRVQNMKIIDGKPEYKGALVRFNDYFQTSFHMDKWTCCRGS